MFHFSLGHNWFRSKQQNAIKANSKWVSIELCSTDPIATIDERYLSFAIDISVLAGGLWWEGSRNSQKGLGSQRFPILNLNSRLLDAYVQCLAPAYLRVGGSEADTVDYLQFSDTESGQLLITPFIWDGLNEFVQRNQLKLMFTFKYGLFSKQQHGHWSADRILPLLHYSKQRGYSFDVCELGNELNAYWAFYGLQSQPSSAKLADDYGRFIKVIREYFPHAKISGPGSAFWPRLGETISPMTNVTQGFLQALKEPLDIIDWHYYPYQSSRSPIRTQTAHPKNLLDIRTYHYFGKYARQLEDFRNKHAPQAELWTSETGSAQCGGQSKLSDRFISSFWWADQLGQGAVNHQKVMIRQSLIGGDYALINRTSLKPNPDFWVSWLWGKLMGTNVYAVTSSHAQIRVYCHDGQKPNQKTLLVINLSNRPRILKLSHFGRYKRRFEITAEKLLSRKVFINGIKPKLVKGKVALSDFPKLSKINVIAPFSINFWCFENAPNNASDNENSKTSAENIKTEA